MMTIKSLFDSAVSWVSFVVNVLPDWFWCVTLGDCMLDSITIEQLQAKRKIFWFLVSIGVTVSWLL